MRRPTDDTNSSESPSASSPGKSYVQLPNPGGGGGSIGGTINYEKKLTTQDALSYLKDVKKKFQHQKGIYNKFCEFLRDFKAQRIDISCLIERVNELFKGHNHLISGFNTFLPKGLEITLDEDEEDEVEEEEEAPPKKTAESLALVNKILIDNDPQPDSSVASLGDCGHSVDCSDLNLDKAVHIEPRKLVEKENIERISRDLDYDGEAEEQGNLHHSPKKGKPSTRSESFEAYSVPTASHYEKNNLKESLCNEEHLSGPRKGKESKDKYIGKSFQLRSKDKYNGKSIQELDLSDCYPIHKTGALDLNDNWVCVNPDYSFKYRHINKYEESLFKCEDDRFELDILLSSAGSAAERGEELLNSIIEKKISLEEGSFVVEDHFTALNLRCIERLYGDHGLEVKEIIRKNPAAALPVILARLKQKQEEWKKCRDDLNLAWADVYAKHHYKSLDHRSFSFKQQDSKYLSAKALVSEIKDLKKKSLKEDNVPHLEYEYLDTSIHEDVFKLVHFSCEEIFSNKEKMSKVLKLWNSFLELMVGVPPRSKDGDPASKDVTTCSADKRSGDVGERLARVFYGNDDFYVLFRLHRILYERISSAKTYCTGCGEMNRRNTKDTTGSPPDPYARFMSALFSLLNGSVENYEFEDECRAIIGNHSYFLFTLDKLLYSLVKQLQAVVADAMDNKLLHLYESEKPDTVYYENARILLHKEENIYRLESSSSPPRLSIQLMDSINEMPQASMDPFFAFRFLQKKCRSNSYQ
ncbi:unnamed protein product [Eruca vesicaria subsp. sativa]|uniref:Histone deacetylase interacting domain-containing protein n=1 Tax=Eruca vesicaria subsp. sativa TaxID=29727 RepID=A0ABC8JNN4_ERUVS|nr:unnamed protein product [Eruca vesicaria subsp. sativa]